MPLPLAAGWLISGLLWLVRSRMGFIITTVLLWLGVSLTTQSLVLTPLIDQIQGSVTGMSGDGAFGAHAVGTLRFLNFDRALTMIFSAYIARQAVTGAKVFLSKRAA